MCLYLSVYINVNTFEFSDTFPNTLGSSVLWVFDINLRQILAQDCCQILAQACCQILAQAYCQILAQAYCQILAQLHTGQARYWPRSTAKYWPRTAGKYVYLSADFVFVSEWHQISIWTSAMSIRHQSVISARTKNGATNYAQLIRKSRLPLWQLERQRRRKWSALNA